MGVGEAVEGGVPFAIEGVAGRVGELLEVPELVGMCGAQRRKRRRREQIRPDEI